MFFTKNFRVDLTLLNKSNHLSNKGLLSILENIAEMHSSSIGYGVTDIEKTNLSWALLNWKAKIISRPKYNDILTVKTWSRYNTKLYSYRDFEVLNSKGDIVCIASSKWVLINPIHNKVVKIQDKIIEGYMPEDKSVFGITDLPKLTELQDYSTELDYKIRKSDIDVNNHMNNLCYLDIATEILPDSLCCSHECNEFEILYKKQIKLSENNIIAYYGTDNDANYVVVKSTDGSILHSIMKFW